MQQLRILAACSAALLVAACGGGGGSSGPTEVALKAGGGVAVRVLSSQPQFVSGGDALIEVTAAPGLQKQLELWLNGKQIPNALRANGERMQGLVDGLTLGDNTLEVRHRTGQGNGVNASIVLTNHPITGPILSGPHLTPYECRTVQNGLGMPLDANCSATTQVVYYYRASNNSFKPLANPSGPRPDDLVNTTTNAGVTVPYIVRVESGTINRGVYRLAMLDDPAASGGAFKPGPGWNGKLVVAFGCCGSAQYNQGVQQINSVLSHTELSRGFAYMNSTELWNNQHANPHLQAETLMMLKEHFIELAGVPKWTVGVGGSGGAIQQYLVAQLSPGLLDGIQPNVSFPDTIMADVTECRLLNNVYRADPARWTMAKQDAINGFNTNTCLAWDLSFASIIKSDNAPGCGFIEPANQANVYNKSSNPTGVRCDLFQTNANLLGKDADGYARRPIDNIGVQYGLGALNRGEITVAEFLDLNERVGGYDNDGNPQVARSSADLEATRLAYAGGFKNSFSGSGLANIPILTQRTNANAVGDIHDTLQDLIVRARLERANGRSDNQVIWTAGSTSGLALGATSLDVMNEWLDNIAADPGAASTDKVARNKPALAQDTCWDRSGNRFFETASTDPAALCNVAYKRYTTPRIEAGSPMSNDMIKCQLKPAQASDYSVIMTAAEQTRLQQVFPAGVCDWSKPSVNQVPLQGHYLKLPL